MQPASGGRTGQIRVEPSLVSTPAGGAIQPSRGQLVSTGRARDAQCGAKPEQLLVMKIGAKVRGKVIISFRWFPLTQDVEHDFDTCGDA
jgi:hypothetical protein